MCTGLEPLALAATETAGAAAVAGSAAAGAGAAAATGIGMNLATLQAAGSLIGAATGLKSLLSGSAKAPDVVSSNPQADQQATEAKAAQDAAQQTAALKQRQRANSLLSRAGGAGDLSPAETSRASASAKVNLGD